jgi:hypothetical protein
MLEAFGFGDTALCRTFFTSCKKGSKNCFISLESILRPHRQNRVISSRIQASELLGVTPLVAPFLLCPEEFFESHGVAGIRRWQPFL